MQTKRIPGFPLILFGREYWNGLLHWMKSTLEKNKLISPTDLQLFTVIDDPKEAVDVILEYMRKVGPPDIVPHSVG